MGVLEDAGIIKNGKVTEAAYRGYVRDVIEMLKTGKGVFPPGVTCTQTVKPNPLASQLDLQNEEIYSDFHKIWKPRYENMVTSLDVPGDFQLAKNGLLPLVDPTAVAKVIGASPPSLDLPGALTAMLAGPPMGTQPFIAAYFPDLALDVGKVAGLLAPNSDFLKILIPSIPIPPIPKLPDPRLLDFGYTERFNFETGLALAPLKTQLKMMVPAIIIGELPGIIGKLAQGDVLGGLVQFVCKQVGGDQPKPMSTSSLEIAAQQVLIQHQVKYQALGFVGQNVGSGIITQALASTPFENGGLAILSKEPEELEEQPPLIIELEGAVREQAKRIIDEVLRPKKSADGKSVVGETFYPDSGFRTIAPSYSPAIIDGKELDWDDAWDYVESLQIKSGEKPIKSSSSSTSAGGFLQQLQRAARSTEVELMSPEKAKQRLAEIRDKSPIFNTMRGYTSCGEMPRYVYSKLLEENSRIAVPGNSAPHYISKEAKLKIEPGKKGHHVANGGLSSFFHVGRGIEEKYDLPRDTVWRIADPFAATTPDVFMNTDIFFPRLGDVMVLVEYTKYERYTKQYFEPRSGPKTPNEKHYHLPGIRITVKHVCLMYDRIYERGKETWVTVDAGQGTKARQGAAFVRRRVFRDPYQGIILSSETNGAWGGDSKSDRIVAGWLDISKVPELVPVSDRKALLNGRPENIIFDDYKG